MTAEQNPSWADFHKHAMGRPPRELLTRTVSFFLMEGKAPGVAIDLGCGSGPETRELLRRGWHVHAVDADPDGLDLLRESVPSDYTSRLETHVTKFEAFDFPTCDFIWAGWAFPYCKADEWPLLVQRATSAVRPGGRIAGDVFGNKHAWAQETSVLTFTEQQLRITLRNLEIEAFDVEDGYRALGELTRWHAFGFSARKPP
jgi:SAM-dependent methyltransferase